MKRFFSLIAALLFAAALLSGCSGGEPAATEEPEPTSGASAAPAPSETPEPTPSEPPALYYNPLSGEEMDEEPGNGRPYAVMINNISVALPQCGIGSAEIIYEVLAEGGITRMMAIFSDISEAGVIGSMRSVRPYYLDIAAAYDAITVHAGGSEQAYYNISAQGIDVIDGVRGSYGEEIFYRERSRMSAGYEHSLFTSAERILEYTPVIGLRSEHGGLFSYGLSFIEDGTPKNGLDAGAISVNFAGHKKTGFTYDTDDGVYYMSQYNKDYIDGNTGEAQKFENVLVLYADTVTLPDEYGHLDVSLTGYGSGYFACGGKYTEISWRRSAAEAPFVYELSDGTRLDLGVGRTFVAVVPVDAQTEVSFS